jgi:hypothetical protein
MSSFQNCVQRVKKGGNPLNLVQIAVENELDLAFGRPTLGGFNVSNLMGITRRMIDIVKKITFYFFQNV